MSRRSFLSQSARRGGGLAVLAAAGYAGYRWRNLEGSPSPSTTTGPPGTSASSGPPYVSRPDLDAPVVSVIREPGWTPRGASDGAYFTLAPKPARAGVHQPVGLTMVDERGGLVWFRRSTPGTTLTDLQVQSYQGQPVLTWWEGTGVEGHGRGTGYIADSTYTTIATVHAGNGLTVDGHELTLTPQGTALITAYDTASADLSPLGGPVDGRVFTCQAQEIDVATGRLLFAWNSLDHVAPAESYKAFSGGTAHDPYDYFHMNSVDLAPDGDLLISARNTWAVYKVSRSSGAVAWRLGGKRSDFAMGPATRFFWQHDARALSSTRLSLFDDGGSPAEEVQSRGLILRLDPTSMTCELERALVHPTKILAASQGNVQVLGDGRAVVGWGNEPYFSEFSPSGQMILDGRLPSGLQSYRAFRESWSGRPVTSPDVAVRRVGSRTSVYCSWNGDTATSTWRVSSGDRSGALSPVATVARVGFETVVELGAAGPLFAVDALDARGERLATSPTVRA